MFKSALAAIASGAVFTVGFMHPASAADTDFIGNWVNINQNTRDITRVVINKSSTGQLNARVFGKCSPSDCDWGTVQLTTYGQNVEDTNHLIGTATYNQGFVNRTVVLRLENLSSHPTLLLQSFSQFTDNSNRQNYVSSDELQKRLIIPRPIPHPIPRPSTQQQ